MEKSNNNLEQEDSDLFFELYAKKTFHVIITLKNY